MERPEYMRINSEYFLQDTKEEYGIDSIIAPDVYIYCKIKYGIYGLKQAAPLAYDKLITNLKKHEYAPDKYYPNIWTHKICATRFYLCVDDFGAKYSSKSDTTHLINALK